MVATTDGWPNVIHPCKKDEKRRRLDEDKRWDLKEIASRLPSRKKAFFGEKKELAG
jgi:hypothetical protein